MIERLAIPFRDRSAGRISTARTSDPAPTSASAGFPAGRPLLFHHGLDPELKTTPIGRQVSHGDARGYLGDRPAETWHKYHDVVAGLINQGALGFSSGAPPH